MRMRHQIISTTPKFGSFCMRGDLAHGISCRLLLMWAPINGSIFPFNTAVRSDNWMPVFISSTSLFGWNTYLLATWFQLLEIALLLTLAKSETPCSLITMRSFAFNLLRAFSLFANRLLSPTNSNRYEKEWIFYGEVRNSKIKHTHKQNL